MEILPIMSLNLCRRNFDDQFLFPTCQLSAFTCASGAWLAGPGVGAAYIADTFPISLPLPLPLLPVFRV